MPKKFDAVFQQRDNRNTKFREVVISGSNLIVQTDSNGNLIGKTLSNTFSSASNYYIQNKLNVGTIFVRDSITSSVYLANPGPSQVGFIGTSSWAMYAVNGGTQLKTGSLYPITSSVALRALTASFLVSGNNYEINNLTASNIYINGQLSASLALLNLLSSSLVTVTNELIAPRITGSLAGTASYALTASAAISASHADIADSANTFRGRVINAFATTGSNSFFGNQSITGSISFTGTLTGSFISASKLFVETGSIYKFYSQKARTDILSGSGYNFSFGYTDLSNAYNFTAVTASFHTLRLTTGSAPMFNDDGNAGEIRIDGDFIYLYAGEAWRRIPANRWFV